MNGGLRSQGPVIRLILRKVTIVIMPKVAGRKRGLPAISGYGPRKALMACLVPGPC